MSLTAGTRLGCPGCTTEVVVIRPATGADVVSCGNLPLLPTPGQGRGARMHDQAGQTLLGKRYVDESSGLELLCTKAGAGQLACAGRPMALKAAKPLPSSD